MSGARPSPDESARTGVGLGSIFRDLLDPICVNSTVLP